MRARGENLELELHPNIITQKPTQVRLLSYVNHANMGDYREAVDLFLAGRTPTPDVVATRQEGRVKYGFGINLEQQVSAHMRTFGRFGWNEGRHESFAYTEVNQTLSFGADYGGDQWHRQHDKVGLAFVSSAVWVFSLATERSPTAGKTSSKDTIMLISGEAYMARSIFSTPRTRVITGTAGRFGFRQ